jgi:hypothetical protein
VISKDEAKSRVKEIRERYQSTKRLMNVDVTFLKRLTSKHGVSYNYAHQILGSYYFSLKDYRRQMNSLKIATKKGRYKKNSVVLLSLAQSHGYFKQYGAALKVIKRAERYMGREPGSVKMNIYKNYANFARQLYLMQRARNPQGADISLVDLSIKKWERLKAMAGAGSEQGRTATRKIKDLEALKR